MTNSVRNTQLFPATAKQFNAITNRLALIAISANKLPDNQIFVLRPRIKATILAVNNGFLSSEKAKQYFNAIDDNQLPAEIAKKLQLPTKAKPKAAPKKQAAKAAPKKKVVAKATTTKDFDTRLTFLEGEVSNMSETINNIQAGMELILETIKR